MAAVTRLAIDRGMSNVRFAGYTASLGDVQTRLCLPRYSGVWRESVHLHVMWLYEFLDEVIGERPSKSSESCQVLRQCDQQQLPAYRLAKIMQRRPRRLGLVATRAVHC